MPVYSDGKFVKEGEWGRLIQSIPSTYTVWKDGSTYRAECNVNGGTDYNDSDPYTVIQNAIDAMSSGNKLFIKNPGENIILTSELEVANKRISISSDYATLQSVTGKYALKIHNEAEYPAADGVGVWNHADSVIENLRFDGNTRTGHGVRVYDSYHVILRNLVAKNCNYGFTVDYASKWTEFTILNSIRAQGCLKSIYFKTGGVSTSFVNSMMTDIGIDITTENAIGFEAEEAAKMWGSNIRNMHIWLHEDNCIGIKLDGEMDAVEFPKIWLESFVVAPASLVGIELGTNMTGRPTFYGYPTMAGTFSSGWTLNGQEYDLYDPRYRLRGTATILNGQTNTGNIAHGFEVAPTVVTATGRTSDTSEVYCSSRDATNFVLTVDGAVGDDRTVDYVCYYKHPGAH